MPVNIFDIKPNEVSTDVKSYSLLLVGPPKIGKSTFMQELYGPRTLFIATEKRFGTMDGAYIAYVSNWTEFKLVLNQLKNPKAKEMYDSVVIDTLDNLQRYCDDYVCGIFDESAIGENKKIYSADYHRAEGIWEKAMKEFEDLDFNHGAIAHGKSVKKEVPYASLSKEEKESLSQETIKDGVVSYQTNQADLEKRYNKHIEKSFDNVIFADYGLNKNGDNVRVIYLRGGVHNGAKVTLKGVPEVIPFDVDELNKTFKSALSQYANTTDKKVAHSDIKDAKYDYEDLMNEVTKLEGDFVNLGRIKEGQKIVTDTLGEGVKVEDLTPNRIQELALLVENLKSALKTFE